MGPTPTITFRVRPDHQPLVRDVVARLKTDPSFSAALTALLANAPSTPTAEAAPNVLGRLKEIERRLAEMEGRHSGQSADQGQAAVPELAQIGERLAKLEDDARSTVAQRADTSRLVLSALKELERLRERLERVEAGNAMRNGAGRKPAAPPKDPAQLDIEDVPVRAAGTPNNGLMAPEAAYPHAEAEKPFSAPGAGPAVDPKVEARRKFGAAVAAARKQRGMSREALAEKIGCSSAFVGMIETGKNSPAPERLDRLIKALPELAQTHEAAEAVRGESDGGGPT